jgi:hypothetical protein
MENNNQNQADQAPSETAPRRYSREMLMQIGQTKAIPKPDQKVMNKLMYHHITRRTWAEKTAKKALRAKRRVRRSKKPELTKSLPSIINLNSRSICNKQEDLMQLLQDNKTDIVVITETWINSENEKIQLAAVESNNPEYVVFSEKRNRSDAAKGGGVMILVNKSYGEAKITKSNEESTEDQLLESIIVKICPYRKPRGYSNCFVVGAYIPPGRQGGNKDKEMNEAVYQLNQKIASATQLNPKLANPLLYIAGDFNGVDISPINRSHATYQINKKATRKDKMLDPILTNAPKCYHSLNLPPLANSDHNIIKALPFKNKYVKTRAKTTTIKRRTGKIEDTVTEIGNIKWELLINAKDLDTQTKVNIFYETINDITDTCQPLKTTRVRGDQRWMTPQIKEEIAIRQRLYHENKDNEWKKQASKVRKMIKQRKKKYYQRYENGDMVWWNEVRHIKGETVNNNEMSQDKCEELNNYFHSVWANVEKPHLMSYTQRNPDDKPIRINEAEVITELNKLDTTKAAGPDKISAKTLKAARFELAEIITFIFNECLAKNVVPSQWREANIAPVPKVKKPGKPEDYRPVCLTSTLCKVLERILAKIIFQRTKSLWLNNQQFGFLPGMSTTDALIQVIEDWANAIDKNQIIWAIFFDFSKAFDLVDHEILMRKLEKYLPRWMTSWIAKYLLDRKQRVKAGDRTTAWKEVEAGVIQGSVLGPILFIIFLSDIEEYLPSNIKAPKYADDILTYCISKKGEENRIQEAAEAVLKWTKDNKMKLNIKKNTMFCNK